MAAKHGVAADAFYFTSTTDLCLHNDTVRALGGPLVCINYFELTIISNVNLPFGTR